MLKQSDVCSIFDKEIDVKFNYVFFNVLDELVFEGFYFGYEKLTNTLKRIGLFII
jgi:hypothetical protein